MGGKRDVYRVLMGKPQGKTLLERPARRQENNIKIGVQEVEWGAFTEFMWLRMGMGGGFHESGTEPPGSITWKYSWLTESLLVFQGGLCSMKIDSLFLCLMVIVGLLVGWLVSPSALAYDDRSSYCDVEAPYSSFRMRLKFSFPTAPVPLSMTSVNFNFESEFSCFKVLGGARTV
jgi:hypothetical protein